MLRIIEALDATSTVMVEGRTCPAIALLEDDDGRRWLLHDEALAIQPALWLKAAASGVTGIVVPAQDGYLWMSAEAFLGDRQEVLGSYVTTSTAWRFSAVFPTARDLVLGPVLTPVRSGFVHLHTHTEYCLDPATPVATADLGWKPIGHVAVGEELVGFDEDLRGPSGARGRGGSRMKPTVVERVARVVRPCYRIDLEDGSSIVASDLHPWVATGTSGGSPTVPGEGRGGSYHQHIRRWTNTEDLVPGKSRLVLWAKPWNNFVPERLIADANWLAGVADGEGWLAGTQFHLGQNPGPVLDKMLRTCKALGYRTSLPRGGASCKTFAIQGYGDTMRFLAQCQPVRFADRWREVWDGRAAGSRYHPPVLVTGVAFLGERETVAITTSTRTFVAAGFLTHNSSWDGYATVQEAVSAAVADDQGALGFTDHGNCAVHPEQAKICKKAGIKPVFGTEAYFVDDRFARDKATERYHHLILLAQNDTGLRNLWAASTEAYRDGFYGKPRLDWSTLERHREGVIASTGCLSGPVAAAVLQGDEPLAKARLARLLEIFGDRLYMEIHTNNLEEQHLVNHVLVTLAREHGVPLLAVTDSHFAAQEQAPQHRAWMQCATSSEVTDDAEVFGFNADSWLLSEADARKALAYLPDHVVSEAMGNTVAIAESCTAALATTSATPTFSKASVEHPDPVASDEQRLLDLCMQSWERKTTGKGYSQEVALARFEHEFPMLVRKGFCGYFLMVADYCRAAKEGQIDGHADGKVTGKPILVGPGRGSGGGSLVAYLSGITGVDPIEGGLLFERFMTEGRTALPDFDVDFPASKKRHLLSYVRERWGQDYVATVGSHLRLKNKGIVRDLGRTMKDTLPESSFLDLNKVSNIIDEAEAGTAGLGLTWEELWAQEGDRLEPYRERYPDLFAMADHLVGRLKTYGKHAAGVVISTDSPLTGSLPLRKATDDDMDEGLLVTQFEKNALEDLGLVKFDLLTIRTLDTIQMCLDLIESQRGLRINVEDWKQEYTDPLVWEQIAAAHTLGIFQIETVSGTRLIKRMKPASIAELADAITLVRPGPMRSGLTEMYLRRRNGDEPVTYPDPRMEQVLAKTFGTLLYQEDIMAACMVLAGYDSVQADEVRSILGKKKVEKIPAAGEQFVAGCVERGMPEEPARALWAQMAEFAKYCVSGETLVHLASAGRNSDGTITAEALYNRINAPLLDPVVGRPKRGEEYAGPCVVCGVTEAAKWMRGACQACYVWRQKFHDTNRGLYGLTVEADGRIRPCRILMVHKHEPAQTWTVTLSDERSITATGNHQHLTPEGLRRVDELQVGDCLLADGGYEQHRYVNGEDRTTVGDRLLVGAINGSSGASNHGYVDGGFTRLMAWTAQAPEQCQECGHDGSVHRLERAHLDGNHANNDWSNLAMLCVSCHKRHDYAYNGRQRRWGKGRLTEAVQIVSIEPRAVEPVYSVVMDDPHIWIANGIATANSFNRAHAYAYAVIGYWCAWLKFHYPVQFLTAALSTVDKDRIPDFIAEARRMGYAVQPPDINLSGVGFTGSALEVRYGLDSLKGINQAAHHISAAAPFASYDDFLARVVKIEKSKVNMGHVATLARIGAFDSLVPNRRALEAQILGEKTGEASRCVHQDDLLPLEVRPQNRAVEGKWGQPLPCTFDWASEPQRLGRTGKPLKVQPQIAMKCFKGCRRYESIPPLDPAAVEPYTERDIREIEHELLGVYLSSTPFDDLDPETREVALLCAEAVEHNTEGQYILAAIITRVKGHRDKNNNAMAFLTIQTEAGIFDASVLSTQFAEFGHLLKEGAFALLEVNKNARGMNVIASTIL